MELIVGGPATRRVTQVFDGYWNNQWSVPIDLLVSVKPSPADLEAARQVRRQNTHIHDEESNEIRKQRWRELIDGSVSGRATLFFDTPPVGNPADPEEAPVQVAELLRQTIDATVDEVLVVSAYLIPTPAIEELFARAKDRGVSVRILTNSIASNNHLSAHSAYKNHVGALLDYGADIHEVRIDAGDRDLYMLTPVGEKALALHAKTLVLDHNKIFIGSPNLDPRSLRLNTEMGLLVESEELNAALRAVLEPDYATNNAWHLQRDESGNITWVSDDETLTAQPASSFMQRIEDWFFGYIPIEDKL